MSLILGISTIQGIVLAADSRAGIKSPRSRGEDKGIGYHDYAQKIFTLPNRVAGIAVSGSFDAPRLRVSSMIDSAARQFANVEANFHTIQEGLHREMNQRGVAHIVTLVAGYQFGHNCLSYWGDANGHNYPVQKEYGFICQYVVDELNQDEAFKSMDMASAIAYAENFINRYSQVDDRWRGIGGEVDILVLESKSHWHKRKRVSDETLGKGELLHLFQTGASGFKIFDGYSKEDMIDALTKF